MKSSSSAFSSSMIAGGWTPQQKCFRNLLVAVRGAYYHDRAKLFWARHRIRTEFYKYATIQPSISELGKMMNNNNDSGSAAVADNDDDDKIKSLVAIGNEIGAFVKQHMEFSVQRVVQHNETMEKLPVEEAKRFRQRYLQREEEHESWCKTRIKMIMRRRPPPPYPFC